MSMECNVLVVPLELYLLRGRSSESITCIPSSQLHIHKPGLQGQSISKNGTKSFCKHELTHTNVTSIIPEKTELKRCLKRKSTTVAKDVLQSDFQVCHSTRKVLESKENNLPQQAEVHRKLANISNLKLNDPLTKKNGTVFHGMNENAENIIITKDKFSYAKHETFINSKEKEDKNLLPGPNKIKCSIGLRRKTHAEPASNGKAGTESQDDQTYGNTEHTITKKRSKQIKAVISTKFLEDVPPRPMRVRKQNYQLEDSDTSFLEPIKKVKTSRKTFPNKPKEQGTGTTENINVHRNYEKTTEDEVEGIPQSPVKQSANKVIEVKSTEIKEDRKSNKDKDREGKIVSENTQEHKHDETEILNRRGRPKRNINLAKDIANVNLTMKLRRSTRQHKVNYFYSEDAYVLDESSSFLEKNKKQVKTKANDNILQKEKATKINVRSISQKENLEKPIGDKYQKHDENSVTMKAMICLDKIRISVLKDQNPNCKEDKENDEGRKEKRKKGSKNGGEEEPCKESESRVNTKNAYKKNAKKSELQSKKRKKSEKPQPEGSHSSQDCKITAKKGTLKYLHQREKYISALAKEAGEGDDDFENTFFAKKKFKFTNLLPPSHEDTLVIKTPKRGINENNSKAVVTPRTTMLGQLQSVTPTTQPYSPCPSLDSNTKNDALKKVYQWMKHKGRQPKCPRKVLHDTSQENIHFTPLELPAVPLNQSGNESETVDEYFADEDSL